MSYPSYYVNGYKFHTTQHGSMKATMNGRVRIKCSNLSVDESDYYGQFVEIVEVEYPALPIKRTVLFKCNWFDPTPNMETRIHNEYKFYRCEP